MRVQPVEHHEALERAEVALEPVLAQVELGELLAILEGLQPAAEPALGAARVCVPVLGEVERLELAAGGQRGELAGEIVMAQIERVQLATFFEAVEAPVEGVVARTQVAQLLEVCEPAQFAVQLVIL